MKPSRSPQGASTRLEDLPNIGKRIAQDLRLIGVQNPLDLTDKDGYALYQALCKKTHTRHDPCVLDTFLAVVQYMKDGKKRPWYDFTKKRKALYPDV